MAHGVLPLLPLQRWTRWLRYGCPLPEPHHIVLCGDSFHPPFEPHISRGSVGQVSFFWYRAPYTENLSLPRRTGALESRFRIAVEESSALSAQPKAARGPARPLRPPRCLVPPECHLL